MITPALADIHRICHGSYWRGLADGGSLTTGHHRHWVMLSYDEALELATTGSYSLPQNVIPESVREWRTIADAADLIASPMSTVEALRDEHERLRSGRTASLIEARDRAGRHA